MGHVPSVQHTSGTVCMLVLRSRSAATNEAYKEHVDISIARSCCHLLFCDRRSSTSSHLFKLRITIMPTDSAIPANFDISADLDIPPAPVMPADLVTPPDFIIPPDIDMPTGWVMPMVSSTLYPSMVPLNPATFIECGRVRAMIPACPFPQDEATPLPVSFRISNTSSHSEIKQGQY
jgi:hypothetical protein